MRCVAVPDQFTRFQDFGGADSVVEDFDAATASGVHRLLGLP
jgi:hypothetical protein